MYEKFVRILIELYFLSEVHHYNDVHWDYHYNWNTISINSNHLTVEVMQQILKMLSSVFGDILCVYSI